MKVFLAIQEDRHIDTEVKVFADKLSAINWAKATAKEIAAHSEHYDEINMRGCNWDFYVEYSCESDCIRVESTEII